MKFTHKINQDARPNIRNQTMYASGSASVASKNNFLVPSHFQAILPTLEGENSHTKNTDYLMGQKKINFRKFQGTHSHYFLILTYSRLTSEVRFCVLLKSPRSSKVLLATVSINKVLGSWYQ